MRLFLLSCSALLQRSAFSILGRVGPAALAQGVCKSRMTLLLLTARSLKFAEKVVFQGEGM